MYFFAAPSSDVFRRIYKLIPEDTRYPETVDGKSWHHLIEAGHIDGSSSWCWWPGKSPEYNGEYIHGGTEYSTLDELVADTRLPEDLKHQLLLLEI